MAEKITCSGPCGEAKDLTEFYGKSKKCKACTLARQKELKASKSKSGKKRAAPKKGKRTTRATPPPPKADPSALQVPASLGFTLSVDEDAETGATNVVIGQSSANGE